MPHVLLPTNEEELEKLAELEYLLFPENNFGVYTLRQELSAPGSWHVLEYTEDLTLKAYCFGRPYGGVFDIMRVGVHPKYRRRGLGTALVQSALRQHPTVMLSVTKSNRNAIRLYKSLGFRINGDLGQQWTMVFQTT